MQQIDLFPRLSSEPPAPGTGCAKPIGSRRTPRRRAIATRSRPATAAVLTEVRTVRAELGSVGLLLRRVEREQGI